MSTPSYSPPSLPASLSRTTISCLWSSVSGFILSLIHCGIAPLRFAQASRGVVKKTALIAKAKATVAHRDEEDERDGEETRK